MTDNSTADLQAGYAAWAEGLPFDATKSSDWREGWQAGDDGAWWKSLAEAVGATLHGFSFRHSATFIFGDQHVNVTGGLLGAFQRLAEKCADNSTADVARSEAELRELVNEEQGLLPCGSTDYRDGMIGAARIALPLIDHHKARVDRLEAENARLREAVRQYRSDMVFFVATDSRERRIAAIDRVLAGGEW